MVSSAPDIGGKEGEVGISQMDGGAEEMSKGTAICGVDESTPAGCGGTKVGIMEMEVEEGDTRSKNALSLHNKQKSFNRRSATSSPRLQHCVSI